MTNETDRITMEMLRQLLSIQSELNDELQGRLLRIKNRLVEFVFQYAPQEADQQARAGQPPETQSEEALVERIGVFLAQGKNIVHPTAPLSPGETIQQVRARLKQSEDRAQSLEQEMQRLNEQLEAARNQLSAVQQVSDQVRREEIVPTVITKPQAPVMDSPDWYREWQNSRGYENDERVIRLMGESGLARRPTLVALAEKTYQMGTSSFHYALDRLIAREMAEKAAPVAKTASVAMDLLLLTELGKSAYQRVAGKPAAESEYEIFAHHSSPEHALLILEAADVLVEENYQVMLKDVKNIALEDGSQLRPDIVARSPEGKTIFVEVERDAYKGQPRVEKWRNLHAATQGELYIICENLASMCQVRNETNQVLQNMKYTRCLTDLRSLRGNSGRGILPKRNAKDGSMWIEKRVVVRNWIA